MLSSFVLVRIITMAVRLNRVLDQFSTPVFVKEYLQANNNIRAFRGRNLILDVSGLKQLNKGL